MSSISSGSDAPPVASAEPASPAGKQRLLSLDFFRGVTIAAMLLVNNAGDEQVSYWPLRHADWNGWTPTDLIFPFFLFIVGVAMAFSLSARSQPGRSPRRLLLHVFSRGLVLFALGVLLNGPGSHYHVDSWRIFGVLQRIAVCYVISALLGLWLDWRGQLAVVASCLVGYWILLRYVPVPGLGVPGRDIPFLDPDRNLTAWLDRKIAYGHLYEITRDPEGILSTLPAIATNLLGLLTGRWLRSARSPSRKAWAMLVVGVLCFALGEVLNLWFPVNKKLWTSSFVVLTAGLALICLAICYWVLDIRRLRGWWVQAFLVFGMNAIAAYVFADLLLFPMFGFEIHLSNGSAVPWQDFLYEHVFLPVTSPANASLAYALSYVLICWAAMWLLYRKAIFLKI
jgi:predicted acyltransferase